jgi:hypothetical protein
MLDIFPVVRWSEIDSALAQAQSLTDLNSLRLKVEMLHQLSAICLTSFSDSNTTSNPVCLFPVFLSRLANDMIHDRAQLSALEG